MFLSPSLQTTAPGRPYTIRVNYYVATLLSSLPALPFGGLDFLLRKPGGTGGVILTQLPSGLVRALPLSPSEKKAT